MMIKCITFPIHQDIIISKIIESMQSEPGILNHNCLPLMILSELLSLKSMLALIIFRS
jgi:hypothetical protein